MVTTGGRYSQADADAQKLSDLQHHGVDDRLCIPDCDIIESALVFAGSKSKLAMLHPERFATS